MKKIVSFIVICLIYFGSCFAGYPYGYDYNNDNFKYSFGFHISNSWHEFSKEEFNKMKETAKSLGLSKASTPVTMFKRTEGSITGYPFIVVNYGDTGGEYMSRIDFKSGLGVLSSNSIEKDLNYISGIGTDIRVNYDYMVDNDKQAIVVLSEMLYDSKKKTQQISAMFYKNSNIVSITLYAEAGKLEDYLIGFYGVINSFKFGTVSQESGGSQKDIGSYDDEYEDLLSDLDIDFEEDDNCYNDIDFDIEDDEHYENNNNELQINTFYYFFGRNFHIFLGVILVIVGLIIGLKK